MKFPVRVEIPATSKARVLLLGVKMTLKRLAVKLELSTQVLREEDWMRRSVAAAVEMRESIEVDATKGESVEKRMMGDYVGIDGPVREWWWLWWWLWLWWCCK